MFVLLRGILFKKIFKNAPSTETKARYRQCQNVN
ncbi:hypothetical protein M2371_002133 [Buttiauxella sp. BIGb0471]|nr:hypothetical protein [Buttiauxella sp. BIGb0471]